MPKRQLTLRTLGNVADGGALAEAIARGSTLRLPVAPEALALLTAVDEPAGCGLTYQVSGFGTVPDAPALHRLAANTRLGALLCRPPREAPLSALAGAAAA